MLFAGAVVLRWLPELLVRAEERAIRGGVWVVSANLVTDPRKPVNAPSGIVGPDGVWRVRAPLKGERLYVGKVEV